VVILKDLNMLCMPSSTVIMPSRTHSSEDAFADDCIAHGFDLQDDPNGNDDILRATINGEYIGYWNKKTEEGFLLSEVWTPKLQSMLH